jgi:putative FmdB family regulatory protein
MPIYTYECRNCGVRFEREQSMADKPLTKCPECKRKQLRKVFVPAGIIFKGSGWYATDHRSPSGQTSRKSEGESGSTDSAAEKDEKSKKAKPDKSDD